MSFKNEEKCPKLREQGVSLNQSGYAAGGGKGQPPPLAVRNVIKDLCLYCELEVCVYDLIQTRR